MLVKRFAPWPCLNPLCPEWQKNHRKASHSEPQVIVSCISLRAASHSELLSEESLFSGSRQVLPSIVFSISHFTKVTIQATFENKVGVPVSPIFSTLNPHRGYVRSTANHTNC